MKKIYFEAMQGHFEGKANIEARRDELVELFLEG